MARLKALALAVAFALPAMAPAMADDATQTGFVPSVLSHTDVVRYREIIADERAGHFSAAKREFERLDDKTLEGYVLAEHMLSHHSGRTPEVELDHWMHEYGDLPIAHRVYDLAVRRATHYVRRHHHRIKVVSVHVPPPASSPHRGGGYEDLFMPDPPLVSAAAREVEGQIGENIHGDRPDDAYAVLQSLIQGGQADPKDIARLSQRVCASYLAEGMNDKAYALGNSAAQTGRDAAPMLDWCAGLSAFRMQNFADSADHFETLAQVKWLPSGTRAAAAFWAARAHIRQGDPKKVVGLLTFAAKDEPTFYGLLAEKLLGEDPQTGFADPVLLPSDFDQIAERPAAHRAVALWQVGEDEKYVGQELSRAFGAAADLKLDAAFAALARIMDVPNVELRASETTAAHGMLLTGLFPIPQYKPLGGYTIDPALVLAFARIETRFQADAESPAGAKGLMQLMPATAEHIGGRGAMKKLSDPSYNMTLGQRYIAALLNQYNGNLVELAAAYNAGPGKVSEWVAARDGKEDDPLMFIESMRSPETRSYVKLLLTYYWMYHRRDGDAAPSLGDVAKGGWPSYRAPAQSAAPPPPPDTDEDDDDDDDSAQQPSS